MKVESANDLATKKCKPCEGGVDACSPSYSSQQLQELNQWELSADGKMISRQWRLKSFLPAMELLNRCAELAEEEQHHPDMHLTGYRNVLIELTTHAIGGLSENDFILAAKIDAAAEALGL